VLLAAPDNIAISSLPIEKLEIVFGEGTRPLTVRHVAATSRKAVRLVDLGHVGSPDTHDAEACLRWELGDIMIFAGTISSNVPCSMEVSAF
jgi:trafficking protein particle complex subunit 11